jgi:uncharacterized phiE125 gp8 family phage protein
VTYAPRWPVPVSVPVQPALVIVASATGNPAIVTTQTPHGLWTGDTVAIAGHSLAALNGSRVVTVLSPTSFSVPVDGTGGTGGTMTRTIGSEPLTVEEGKLRAGLDWVVGDERDALMAAFIAAARQKVEADTGRAIVLTYRDVSYDWLPNLYAIPLPWPSVPLQAVESITYHTAGGIATVVPVTVYEYDLVQGVIGLAPAGSWPTGDLQNFGAWVLRILSGYPTKAAIPPLLLHAVGLLTAHYATAGRDLVTVGTIVSSTPYGYEDAIAPFRLEAVA